MGTAPHHIDPAAARQFAVEVVATLRQAGKQALWAGGCVRDQLLGLTPKDYDVATDALPEEIPAIFRRRKTIPLGVAFGVMTIVGPRNAGQIEVATFRRDATYSDGRHPDAVTFSTPEEDAQRRDFTINGLFFDPLAEQVIDYVEGEEDLRRGVIRAIGEPRLRIQEDKLRMLRGVRFAATFGFELDRATTAAIRDQALELTVVSAERIAGELRRMWTLPRRVRSLELLRETNLLPVILPESALIADPRRTDDAGLAPGWQRTLQLLARLPQPRFPAALAAVLREIRPREMSLAEFTSAIASRWHLANDERDEALWLLEQESLVRAAVAEPWPRVQRVLAANPSPALLDFAAGVAEVTNGDVRGIEFCAQKLSQPTNEWDPLPLIFGGDLIAIGLKPGPLFRAILEHVRDAQLLREITTQSEAIGLARSYAQQHGGDGL